MIVAADIIPVDIHKMSVEISARFGWFCSLSFILLLLSTVVVNALVRLLRVRKDTKITKNGEREEKKSEFLLVMRMRSIEATRRSYELWTMAPSPTPNPINNHSQLPILNRICISSSVEEVEQELHAPRNDGKCSWAATIKKDWYDINFPTIIIRRWKFARR